MLRMLKNQRGFLQVLATIVIVGVPLMLLGVAAQRISQLHDRGADDIFSNADATRAEAARELQRRLTNIAGDTLNPFSVNGMSLSPDQLRNTINIIREANRYYERTTQSPPSASNPLPSDVSRPGNCTSSSLNSCTNRRSCQNAGGTWQPNNRCGTAPVPRCRRNNLSGCTSQRECEDVGGYWYNGACNASAPCNSSNLQNCTTENDCRRNGGFWYDDHCNVSPKECYTNVTLCRTQTECLNAGGYWYEESCHVNSKCADQGDVCTCQNGQEICCNQVCDRTPQCSDGSDEWACDCDESGVFKCDNGKLICRNKVCNRSDDCGDGSDERECQNSQSCCVVTGGCPGETATACAETCCCCPYGQVCDRDNFWNGCISSL